MEGTVDSIVDTADENVLQDELEEAQRQQVHHHTQQLPVSINALGEDDAKLAQIQLDHLAQLQEHHSQLLQQAQAQQVATVLELQRAQMEQARAAQQQAEAHSMNVDHLGLQGDDGSEALSPQEQEQQLLLQQQQLEAHIQQQAAIAQHQAALAQQLAISTEGIPLSQPGLTGDSPSSPTMTSSFHLGPTVQAPVYCLCQQPFDGLTFMVACDHCNQWFHGKCVNISEEDIKKSKGGYICPTCKAKMETETHEATLKRLREEGNVADAAPEPGTPTSKRRKAQHQRGERFCRFPGCDKRISCRSYCSRHQKQKERAGKRGKIFSTSTSVGRRSGSVGRPKSPFTPQQQTRSPKPKSLKRSFEDKLPTAAEFAGAEADGASLLEKYLTPSYGQKRPISIKGDKISQRIGTNAVALVCQLPPASPLRRPLMKALGDTLAQSEIADTFHVSRKTVERGFALPVEEHLLFSLVSRPRGMKMKGSSDASSATTTAHHQHHHHAQQMQQQLQQLQQQQQALQEHVLQHHGSMLGGGGGEDGDEEEEEEHAEVSRQHALAQQQRQVLEQQQQEALAQLQQQQRQVLEQQQRQALEQQRRQVLEQQRQALEQQQQVLQLQQQQQRAAAAAAAVAAAGRAGGGVMSVASASGEQVLLEGNVVGTLPVLTEGAMEVDDGNEGEGDEDDGEDDEEDEEDDDEESSSMKGVNHHHHHDLDL